MAKQSLIIFCILFLVINASDPEPRDLVEEAYQQLFELQNIAYGEIFVGRDRLQHLQREFGDDAQKVAQKANLDIEQEHETINIQLTTIKDLALSAGKDISSCTNNREDLLNSLPANYNEQISSCMAGVAQLAATAVTDSRYFIDILINKVHQFGYQLDLCYENFECISPLLTQILLERVRIPQVVREEVQNCETIISELELSVQNCADESVAEYTVEASGILAEITDCVDEIIG
ncbi:hypothetical protein Zmor_000791 [Zophobas morio]|uniref:Protein TsetseEP domain-containing protein n=1 Tax=Zophobas morio TaxID=2755281 RepID=A0AA38IZY5_9CUCU|nr:hypothetical protein Zmor_000791 [Zophobas morio]